MTSSMPPCSVTNSALGVQAPLRRKGPSPAELTASVRPRAQTLRVPVSTTEQEEVQVQVTRVLVESYFDIVRKNLQDAVPKARRGPSVPSMTLGGLHHCPSVSCRGPCFYSVNNRSSVGFLPGLSS